MTAITMYMKVKWYIRDGQRLAVLYSVRATMTRAYTLYSIHTPFLSLFIIIIKICFLPKYTHIRCYEVVTAFYFNLLNCIHL